MMECNPETYKAIDAGRIHYFVFFDFMFFPFRVHSGKGHIEWDGYEWKGIGQVLMQNFSYDTTQFNSLSGNNRNSGFKRGHLSASLPLDKKTREIVTKGYHRGRKMTLQMCSYDGRGNVIERIAYASNEIIKYTHEDNVITFSSQDTTLVDIAETDARHKKTVDAVREQFSSELLDSVKSGWVGWILNFVNVSVGNFLGIAAELVGFFIPSKRRCLKQRWKARKRVYRFMTFPNIPGVWAHKKGYKIRADTLEKAKTKLYLKIVKKVWRFPRGYIELLVEVDGTPFEFFNLDHVRQYDDYKRWKETDPSRQWLKDN